MLHSNSFCLCLVHFLALTPLYMRTLPQHFPPFAHLHPHLGASTLSLSTGMNTHLSLSAHPRCALCLFPLFNPLLPALVTINGPFNAALAGIGLFLLSKATAPDFNAVS